jgi:hypothetical protein
VNYRVYLLQIDNHIQAAESFSARDDREAEEVALALYGNCSTSFHAIELWQGPQLIMRRTGDITRPTVNLLELIERRQESVVKLEEVLAGSFECIRQSRQLMAALDEIREP